jgi:hypothetical protein
MSIDEVQKQILRSAYPTDYVCGAPSCFAQDDTFVQMLSAEDDTFVQMRFAEDDTVSGIKSHAHSWGKTRQGKAGHSDCKDF